VPSGQSTHNLLKLAQPTLVPDLKLAVNNALASQHAVVINGLRDFGTGDFSLSLRVTPLQTAQDGNSPRLLVSFIQGAQEMARQDNTTRSDQPNHVNSDSDDWPAWTEAMRMSQEELEASREELQVLNEELKATNEQLNLSYEEINRANARLREKIDELEMQGRVLSSGAVMAISLDEEFRVRWCTPGMSELFPLLPDDKGRRITDFAQKFDDTNFITDVQKVMQRGHPIETEVKNSEGRWYLRCIRPYRADSEATDGVAITFTNITARKSVEDALHESEARLSAALIAGQMAHWRWNPEHDEAIASDTMEALFGLLPGERWKSSAQGFRLVHPDDRARHQAMVEAAGRENTGWHTEFRIIRPCDGQVAWLEERANPSRDPFTGKTTITGLVWDITKRKRAEEALRKSEAELTLQLKRTEQLQKLSTELIPEQRTADLYAQIVESASILMHSDAASMQEFVPGTGALKLLAWRGFHPTSADHWQWVREAGGSSCALSLYSGKREVVPDAEQCGYMQGTQDLKEFRRSRIRAVQSTPLKARNGDLLGMISTHWREPYTPSVHELQLFDVLARQAADLIARTQAETALRASEERNRRVLETDAVGVLFFDIEGILIDANDVFLKMTGYSREEVRSQKISWRTMTPPEWITVSEQQMAVLKATGRIGPYEKEYFLKNGRRAWMLFAGRDLGDGTIAEFAIDISDRKRVEAALRESEAKYRKLFEDSLRKKN